ncbi:hypothetical protein [Mesorhizobium sp. AR07]|uniref:hypothetical protein n=1 Tax=Mesorhizobium sp. AR07 TaxID=2865838 RepID=UPI002160D246|nr:hypothetical protein [Mesorhizobium sp. AR07]
MPKLRLEDRLQKCLDRALNDAILDRGNAQGPELPRFTGLAPRRARSVCAGAQFGLKPFEEALLTDPIPDAAHGHPVDPGRTSASVAGYALPGVTQHAEIGDPTPHVPPRVFWICLTPLIEFALSAEYLVGLMTHVHRSLLRHAGLPVFLLPFALCTAFPRSD